MYMHVKSHLEVAFEESGPGQGPPVSRTLYELCACVAGVMCYFDLFFYLPADEVGKPSPRWQAKIPWGSDGASRACLRKTSRS
jgi:hypothetical protein